MQTISIGPTTIIGWSTALAGALPTLIKLLEGASTLHGPEKAAALASLISLAVTQIGRYAQAHAKAKTGAIQIKSVEVEAAKAKAS